jgi:S1-C subfamily serine protease
MVRALLIRSRKHLAAFATGLVFAAMPVDLPKAHAQSLPAPVPRTRFGAYVEKLTNGPGITVTGVMRGTPATRILVERNINGRNVWVTESLVPGDVILSIDGVRINSFMTYADTIALMPAGHTFEIRGIDSAHGGRIFYATAELDD